MCIQGSSFLQGESPKPSWWGQGRICPKLHPGTRGCYNGGWPLRPRGHCTPRWSGSAGQPLTNTGKKRTGEGVEGQEEPRGSSLRRTGQPDPAGHVSGKPSCSAPHSTREETACPSSRPLSGPSSPHKTLSPADTGSGTLAQPAPRPPQHGCIQQQGSRSPPTRHPEFTRALVLGLCPRESQRGLAGAGL